jgi:hypothetical protein
MMRQTLCLACLALFLLLGSSVPSYAQSEAEPAHDTQWWPDTQVNIRLNDQLSYVLFVTIRPGRNRGAVVTQQYGTGLNWEIHPRLNAVTQYRYIISDPTEQRHAIEHRFHLELIPRLPLGKDFTLVNRTRAEYRNINGTASGRFRNRVWLEKELNIREHPITPYISGETYFDTRSHTFSRNQAWVGTRLPVNDHLTFDLFYMHSWDARVKPGFWHVIGTFLRFDL